MNTLRKFAVMGVVGLMASTAWADVKIRTKTTTAGHAGESTVYIKGARQRSEMTMGPGMTLTSVLQCDQKRTVQINNSCKVYMVSLTEEEGGKVEAAAQPAAKPASGKPRRGGVTTFVSSTTDTTERKTLFGYVARHLKNSMTSESSPDACTKAEFRMEADGWYANLSVGLTCSASPHTGMGGGGGPGAPPDCQDRIRFRRTGPSLGYPLQETRTIYSGGQSFTTTTETLELSKAPLEDALFEIPAGYREVTSMQELMCMGDMQSMMAKAMKGEVPDTQAAAAAAAAGAKKGAGKLRIGVVGFVNKTQGSLAVEAPRQRLVEEIIAREVDAVPLDQTTPEEIVAEAREKECDFILYTDVTKLKQGGGKLGGMFGKVTGGAGGMGKYEVAVNFRLFATGDEGARLASTATTKGEGEPSEVVASVMTEEAQQAVAEALRKQ